MKILALLFLLPTFAWAISGREAWKHANMRDKVYLLQEYKAYFESNPHELAEWQDKVSRFTLFSEAWAADPFNCIYAGWPSQKNGRYCSSPARGNPGYSAGTCGAGQLSCQPLLFGEGLCASTATAKLRNTAFSQCEKKFQASGKKTEDIIKEIKDQKKENDLLALLDFADKTCTEGSQKSTGMCRRLQAAVARVRNALPTIETPVVVEGQKVEDPIVNTTVTQAVAETATAATEVVEAARGPAADCDPTGEAKPADEKDAVPFDRDTPREFEMNYSTSRQGSDPAWQDVFAADKQENLYPMGFEFRMGGPNEMAGSPLDANERVERNWNFVSNDGSKRDSYLWITDDAGSGYLSQLMETVIVMVPRKEKPHVEAIGDELHVTLATGEKVVYDKTTKLIKSGVLKEGPVDLNPNRFDRKFAPVKYSGTGISLRFDKRGEDPRLIIGNAEVTQNGFTCKVPARELWNDTDFKYTDDKALVEYLNTKCQGKFKL